MTKLTVAFTIALLLVAFLVLPIAAQTPSVDDMGKNYMCMCGCGAQLPNCLHSTCSVKDQMNATIAAMLDQGKSQADITKYFVAQYGEVVLSSPTKKGFNLTAWVTPFVAIIAGGVALFFVLRAWARRGSQAPAAVEAIKPEVKDEYRRQLEKELNEFKEGLR